MAEPALKQVSTNVAKAISRSRVRTVISAAEHSDIDHAPELQDLHTCVKDLSEAKDFHTLPGPKGLPVLGTAAEYFRKANRGQMHEVQRKFHKTYGTFFRERLGPVTNASIADPKLVEELFRKEGKVPTRPPYESWVLYKALRSQKGGVMSSTGEEWQRYRSALSKKLLRPKYVHQYIDTMNDVNDSLIERIRFLRNIHGRNDVPELPNELCKWASESITSVLLEKRIGCLENDMPEEAQEFIDSVGKMFLTGHQLMVFANVHKKLKTRIWRTHVAAWDSIYKISESLIKEKLEKIHSSGEMNEQCGQEETPTGFLQYVLANNKLSDEEILTNTTEILLSGVDTSSNALGFALYLLAKNPRVQEKLQGEIMKHIGNKNCSNPEELQSLSYVKAIVKETLRLYPVIPINARVMNEDTVIDGYKVPKGTCILLNIYTMSRDEKYFTNSDEFIPERWMREEVKNWHPFTVIPFGFGARSCIGRRIAEQELYLSVIKLCQNFWLKLSADKDIKPYLRTLLTVESEFPVEFIDR